jgi:hypothetical protein
MRIFVSAALLFVAAAVSLAGQQAFSGRLSETTCGVSHHAVAGSLTDRQCVFMCIKRLAKWALVDKDQVVIPIANQDAMGLPLYAGRLVRLTGESQSGAILVTKVEAIPAHLHLGHVMTNWRDTPGSRGFLPVAIDEARVAVQQARLAAKATALDEIALHAGHVLHALDTAVEPKGPGAGYGVRKAAAGAKQHVEFAARAEGASEAVVAEAAQVATTLATVLQQVDEAVAAGQKARAATNATDAARFVADLVAIVTRLDDQLEATENRMTLLLKTEGLFGAPR